MELIDENFVEILRKKHNMVLAEIAVKINMTPRQLGEAICEPETFLNFKQVCDLAKVLECNPCHLFTDPERIQCIPNMKNPNFFEEREKYRKSKQV